MKLCSRALLLCSLIAGRHHGKASCASRSDPGFRWTCLRRGGRRRSHLQGHPYAKPPVGDLRWRAPQPAAPWSGMLAADHFSPICVQPDPLGGHSFFTRLFFIPIEPRSEDCLYLNGRHDLRGASRVLDYVRIWTMASAGDRRPVMVWIPGGGFVGGSAGVKSTMERSSRKRRRAGLYQLSAVEVRLPGVARTIEGIGPSRVRQLWLARPDRGAAVGEAEYHRIWRRSRQCHHLRPVRGIKQHDISDGVAVGQGTLPPRDRRKRGCLCRAGCRLAARPHIANRLQRRKLQARN